MELVDLLLIMSFGALLLISLKSIAMMAAKWQFKSDPTKRKLLALTIGYFACVFISNSTVILFIFEPHLYLYTSSLSFLSLALYVVLFYHIIFILTSGYSSKKISPFHYAIPVLLTFIHIVWGLFIPYDIKYNIITNRILYLNDYKLFSLFYSAKLWVYAAYVMIYGVLILIRMPSYHIRIMNYSADEEKTSLRWIYIIIVLTIVITPVFFISFFIKERGRIIDEVIVIIANILYFTELIILRYNMFTENYVIISPNYNYLYNNRNYRKTINKKEFEKYITQTKPYLKKNLKIKDIIYEFHTCRSYMSSFINHTYEMNFSQYINTLRMDEYEKLKKDPENSKKSNAELISAAGFSYRGFIRFRKKNRKNK